MRTGLWVYVLAVLAITTSSGRAEIVNGGFEDGLTGWTVVQGSVSSVTTALGQDSAVWEPSEGSRFAFLDSWSVAELPQMMQVFQGTAGQSLQFDYRTYGYNADARGTISIGSSTTELFARTWGDEGNYRWTPISYTLPATGTYTLSFSCQGGEIWIEDPWGVPIPGPTRSCLGVDNIRMTVPEPATLACLAGACPILVGLAIRRARRR